MHQPYQTGPLLLHWPPTYPLSICQVSSADAHCQHEQCPQSKLTILCMWWGSWLGQKLPPTFMDGLVPHIFQSTRNSVHLWTPQHLPQGDPSSEAQSLQFLLVGHAENRQLGSEEDNCESFALLLVGYHLTTCILSTSIITSQDAPTSGAIWNRLNTAVALIALHLSSRFWTGYLCWSVQCALILAKTYQPTGNKPQMIRSIT